MMIPDGLYHACIAYHHGWLPGEWGGVESLLAYQTERTGKTFARCQEVSSRRSLKDSKQSKGTGGVAFGSH
eukprot:1158086-Pelagomonas_calceolata.AAC.25